MTLSRYLVGGNGKWLAGLFLVLAACKTVVPLPPAQTVEQFFQKYSKSRNRAVSYALRPDTIEAKGYLKLDSAHHSFTVTQMFWIMVLPNFAPEFGQQTLGPELEQVLWQENYRPVSQTPDFSLAQLWKKPSAGAGQTYFTFKNRNRSFECMQVKVAQALIPASEQELLRFLLTSKDSLHLRFVGLDSVDHLQER
ncbi:MAG: hypothetical protein ACO1OQ_15295 [Rufibacter sp.]